jgi:hypothetical protein
VLLRVDHARWNALGKLRNVPIVCDFLCADPLSRDKTRTIDTSAVSAEHMAEAIGRPAWIFPAQTAEPMPTAQKMLMARSRRNWSLAAEAGPVR